MGQSAEELTAQIAQTRDGLSSSLDELQDKVSPSAIVDRQKQAARNRVSGVKDKVMGVGSQAGDKAGDLAGGATDTAQDRYQGAPLAAGIAAFGLGLVVAAVFPATAAETKAASQVEGAAKEHGQPLLDQAKSTATDVGKHLADQAGDAAQQVKDVATDAAADVQQQGRDGVDAVRSEAPGPS